MIHPTKPIGNPFITSNAAAEQFTHSEEPKLPPGSFSSPVRIQNLDLNEKGLKNLEKPVFISKGQKSTNESNTVPLEGNHAPISNTVQSVANLDVQEIKQRLGNLKEAERTKKLKALNKARFAIQQSINELRKNIKKETNELLSAKSSSLSLTTILHGYEQRLKKDQLAHLKLADRVEIKNKLKDKLIKEMQGFRTRPSDYKELLDVDKVAIKEVIKAIKSQLEPEHADAVPAKKITTPAHAATKAKNTNSKSSHHKRR